MIIFIHFPFAAGVGLCGVLLLGAYHGIGSLAAPDA